MLSGIRKKYSDYLLWRKLVWKAPNVFHVPYSKRRRYARLGFSANETVWFDFDHNDYREYISNYERTLAREINGKYKIVLDNKILFEDVFKSRIRVSLSYAWISNGTVYARNGFDVEEDNVLDFLKEKKDAVLKIEEGAGGRGVHMLHYQEGSFKDNGEKKKDEEILSLIRSQKKAFLCEFVHQSDFENALYPYASNTIRIICAKKKNEKYKTIIGAVHRIGNETSRPVDNVSSGALAAGIDIETGMLGSAVAAKSHHENEVIVKYDRHPDTDAPIKGQVVPHWEEIKKEITEVSNHFPYLNLIAWDIMLTEEGLCVVEANASSGLMMFQTEHGVRNSKIGDVLRSYGYLG